MRIRTDKQIRHKLIRSLGIDQSPKMSNSPTRNHTNHKSILTARTEEVPLKNHCGYNASDEGSCFTKIQFNSVVKSTLIPSHQDYSDRVKRLLWTNCREIKQNAQRNAREFAFEGWSAQYVLEEDQMYLDVGSMQFIHPVHVVGFS